MFNYLVCHGGARHDGTPVNLAYQVSCKKCRACGPLAKTAQEAVKGWEYRAAPRLSEEPPALLPEIAFEDGEEEENEAINHERLDREQGAPEEIFRRRKAVG